MGNQLTKPPFLWVWVDNVLSLGIGPDQEVEREIRIANGWIAICVVLALAFVPVFYLLGAVTPAAVVLLTAASYVIALVPAAYGKHTLSRYVFLTFSNLAIWFCACHLGPGYGVEIYFGTSALQSFTLFSYAERKHALVFMVLAVVLGAHSAMGVGQVVPRMTPLPPLADALLPPILVGFATLHTALGVFHLRTQVHRNDERFRRAQVQLRRSNTQLEQFAFIASHDLQEPLRTVKSFVELLQDEYGPQLDDQAQQYIRFASRGTFRMQQLVEGLLQYSRINGEDLHLEVVDVEALVQTLRQDLAKRIADTQAQLSVGELHPVHADQQQLYQLILNLVTNALKFQRKGVAPTIHLQTTRTSDHWTLSVADNGIGMDLMYAKKIFLAFQRLHSHEAFSGSGIGLAVVKRVVDLHGGSVWLESEVGSGTTFFVRLPTEQP